MTKAHILIVEDDKAVKNLISTALEMDDYTFSTAENGTQAILAAASGKPDSLLLDLGLPDIDGVQVIEKIRSWSQMPIIVISARSEDHDKIEALDAGADDYLTKPFSIDELRARLRATLRRLNTLKTQETESHIFINGNLTIDYSAGYATLEGKELHLTPYEYKLLCLRMGGDQHIKRSYRCAFALQILPYLSVFISCFGIKRKDGQRGQETK